MAIIFSRRIATCAVSRYKNDERGFMATILKTAILFFVIFNTCFAQEVKTLENLVKARQAFDAKDFKRAIQYYELVISDDSITDEIQSESYIKLADAYEQREEFRDSAYFYGEFVRTTKMTSPEFENALYKAGVMNARMSHPKRDQGYSDMAIFYLTHYLELYPTGDFIDEAQTKIANAHDVKAEFHFEQFGTYYYRHDNYCGAFISFDDSLESSDKFKTDIVEYTKQCKASKDCSEELVECSTRFDLSNINGLGIFNFSVE